MNGKRITIEDISFLFQEVQNAWMLKNIPSFHREIFTKNLELIQPSDLALVLATEVNEVENSMSSIQKVLGSIEKRELIIGKFLSHEKKCRNTSKDSEIAELESAHLIVKMRESTAGVIKLIRKWKSQFTNINCEFYWNQICYMEKIKHDTDQVKSFGKFHFVNRDPFFLSMEYEKVSVKAKSIVKVSQKDRKLFKKLEKEFNYGMPDAANIRLSQALTVSNEADDVFSRRIMTREELEKLETENIQISIEKLYSLIDICVNDLASETIYRMKYEEMLEDLSNQVLEDLIAEFCKSQGKKYFDELALDHSEVIYNKLNSEFLDTICVELIPKKELLSQMIAFDLFGSFKLNFFVTSSVSELVEETEKVSQMISEVIIEDFLTLYITENISHMINYQKLKKDYKSTPLNKIKMINPHVYSLLISGLLDDICRDLIKSYPGKKWLESIAKFSFDEVRGEDEPDYKVLLPI